jgi:hypothetical protein
MAGGRGKAGLFLWAGPLCSRFGCEYAVETLDAHAFVIPSTEYRHVETNGRSHAWTDRYDPTSCAAFVAAARGKFHSIFIAWVGNPPFPEERGLRRFFLLHECSAVRRIRRSAAMA